MKKFSVLLLMLVISAVANATTDLHERARVAFMDNEGVFGEILDNQDLGFSRTDAAVPSLVHGQCGFVGCSKTFLVVQEMANDEVNRQFKAVLRFVTLPAHMEDDDDIVIEPVTLEKLEKYGFLGQ